MSTISYEFETERAERVLPGFQRPVALKKQYSSFNLHVPSLRTDPVGVVLGCDQNTDELILDSTDTHTLVYGSTGSMKTRCVVLPTMKVLGCGGESMIVNDSKGELYNRTAGFLEKQGYQIRVLNFRASGLGNSWNPFYIPFQYYRNGDLDRAAEFANDIASIIALSQVSGSDPFWDYSAYDCILGLILLLFRYCKEKEQPIGSVNVSNLIRLRRELFQNGNSVKTSSLWTWAQEDELVAASLSGSVNAPSNTRSSILSVVDQKLRAFSIQPALLDMLANNDVDIARIGTEKTAVFLITPDEKTTYHRLVSLFIKQSYEYLIYSAVQGDGALPLRINYILDEFSTLPAIHDFSSMISAARSRNIRFLLVVQSKNQLAHRYQEEAATITANCANWIFLTSRELDLLRDISELCGTNRQQVPNISVYDLQHFSKERAEALVLAGRSKPCMVQFMDIDRLDALCGGRIAPPVIKAEPRADRIDLDFRITPPKDSAPEQSPIGSDRFSFPIGWYSPFHREPIKPLTEGLGAIDFTTPLNITYKVPSSFNVDSEDSQSDKK